MSGQGRPHIRPGASRAGRTNRSSLSSLALVALLACAAAAHADDVDIRVRIAWGGGDARAWQGTIRISQGTLSDPAPLGLEADAPGSLLPESSDTIRIHRRTPRTYDGCDLHVQAPADATLLVQLSAERAGEARPLEIPLARLLKGFVQFDLDTQRNRLLAQRSPGEKRTDSRANDSSSKSARTSWSFRQEAITC